MSSSLKFRQTNTFLEDETLTIEHPEVLEVGLVTGKNFIRSLVQAFVEVEPIRCMAVTGVQTCALPILAPLGSHYSRQTPRYTSPQ